MNVANLPSEEPVICWLAPDVAWEPGVFVIVDYAADGSPFVACLTDLGLALKGLFDDWTVTP